MGSVITDTNNELVANIDMNIDFKVIINIDETGSLKLAAWRLQHEAWALKRETLLLLLSSLVIVLQYEYH